jgi:MinD superfamily P-loop ATPase
MNIAIASGKGGTGKTTVAVNLALSLEDVQLFDCDVEEPNCNLFLGYELEKVGDINVPTPVIGRDKCNLCGKCSDFCMYNAIALLPGEAMVFPSLCHGCGGCTIVCPMQAIVEEGRSIGIIKRSVSGNDIEFYQGLLDIGEPMASPIIKSMHKYADADKISIFDAPPGAACPVIACVGEMDYCILVAEPTTFGFHDMMIAVEVLQTMDIPFGVIINRFDMGDNRVEEYCREHGVPVLMKIPNDKKIAQLYSRGVPFVTSMPEWRQKFAGMLDSICSQNSGGVM